eukprot:gene31470-6658_t
MPFIQIVMNTKLELDAKQTLVASLTSAFSEEIKIPKGHIHTMIRDGEFFAFGGDVSTPSAWATVKSSNHQIAPEVRKLLVTRLVPLLTEACPGLIADRTVTLFEEMPVENIAIGTHIMVFRNSMDSQRNFRGSMDTGKSNLGKSQECRNLRQGEFDPCPCCLPVPTFTSSTKTHWTVKMSNPLKALQESAYYSVVRAFFAGNKLGFDAEAAQLSAYAPSVSNQGGPRPMAAAASLPSPHPVQLPLHQPHLMPLDFGALGAAMALPAAGGGPKKNKSAKNTPASTPQAGGGGLKRPPPLLTPGYPSTGNKANGDYYGGSTKKIKTAANTPAYTPASTKTQKGGDEWCQKGANMPAYTPAYTKTLKVAKLNSHSAMDHMLFDNALLPEIHSAESQLAQLNNRERQTPTRADAPSVATGLIFTELVKLGVRDDDPELNDVHRALLKWYRADLRQHALVAELEAMNKGSAQMLRH